MPVTMEPFSFKSAQLMEFPPMKLRIWAFPYVPEYTAIYKYVSYIENVLIGQQPRLRSTCIDTLFTNLPQSRRKRNNRFKKPVTAMILLVWEPMQMM